MFFLLGNLHASPFHFRQSRNRICPTNREPRTVRRPVSLKHRAMSFPDSPWDNKRSTSAMSAALSSGGMKAALVFFMVSENSPTPFFAVPEKSPVVSDTGGAGSRKASSSNRFILRPSQASPPKVSSRRACSGDSQTVIRRQPSALRRSRNRACRGAFVVEGLRFTVGGSLGTRCADVRFSPPAPPVGRLPFDRLSDSPLPDSATTRNSARLTPCPPVGGYPDRIAARARTARFVVVYPGRVYPRRPPRFSAVQPPRPCRASHCSKVITLSSPRASRSSAVSASAAQ